MRCAYWGILSGAVGTGSVGPSSSAYFNPHNLQSVCKSEILWNASNGIAEGISTLHFLPTTIPRLLLSSGAEIFLGCFWFPKLCSWCPVHVTWSWCFGGSCEEPPVMSSFQTRRHSPKQQATIQNTVAAYASRVQNACQLYDELTVPVAFDWAGAYSTASTCSVS